METGQNGTRNKVLASLREQLRRSTGIGSVRQREIVSTGSVEMDRLLPRRGIQRGSLVEWLGERGHGAATLALVVARYACAEGRVLVVIDRQGSFYPPSAAALGIELNELIVVRPRSQRDEIWAFDQALRSRAVAAVWGRLEEIPERAYRRLQLSAESGESMGLLIRSPQYMEEPTWAEVSLHVQACPAEVSRRFRVSVVRCQGGQAGGCGLFEWDEATGRIQGVAPADEASSVPLVSQLAPSESSRRQTGT